MTKTKFGLIDKNDVRSEIYSSTDFDSVLHEYLSILNEKLILLNSFDLKTIPEKLLFNNLFMIEYIFDDTKKHTFVVNTITFDFSRYNLKGEKYVNISSYFNSIIQNIQSNYEKIINTKNSNPQSNHQRHNSHTQNIVAQKKLNIKSEPEQKPPIDNSNIDTEKVETIKTQINDQMKILSTCFNEIEDKKRKLKMKKEKEREKFKIFESNKNSYNLMLTDIKKNIITEDMIPSHFKDTFQVLKFMDNNNLLGTEDEYKLYVDFMADDESEQDENKEENKEKESSEQKSHEEEITYVPHNIHYLPEEEKKKYPSYEEVMKSLEDEIPDLEYSDKN